MGEGFNRDHRHKPEGTRVWVNIDPEGEVYICQHRLTEHKNSLS